MKTLLLWDIDGTLIVSGGAGERALLVALHQESGIAGALDGVELAGRTDPWIARRLLAKYNLPVSPPDITRFLERYLAALPAELNHPLACALPGVREIVTTVTDHSDIAQGLLTGNLRRGAQIKLSHHDLWQLFTFGAFSDDSETRNDLGPHALRRAREHHGVDFTPERVFVIGDTPHDIDCGRAIGARTIGVATGRYSVAELQAHAPTVVFPDFSDTAAFFSAIGIE